MALDHALLHRAAATGEAVLRVYSWRVPTLSLGRHQPAIGHYDLNGIRAAGIDVVRRPTGGRAVLHHREVTYSVTAPLARDGLGADRARVRQIYRAINALLVDALRRLGVPAALALQSLESGGGGLGGDIPAAPRPSEHPCFDVATEGEVVVGGRKLVGSAQWRDPGAVLQHGSILIADDQALLGTVSLARVAPAPVATLGQLLHRDPSVTEVAGVLGDALDDALREAGAEPGRDYPDDTATAAVALTLRAQYADDAWTWRR